MKITQAILLTFLFFSLSAFGQIQDTNYGKPLIVLTEMNPWRMVIGSDVPTFALYENGQIIYQKKDGDSVKIYEVKHSPEQLQKVIKSLSISPEIYKLPGNIEASGWTDQPTNILFLNFNAPKKISVYGNLKDDSREGRSNAPKEFLTVYDNIKKYRDASAKEWIPEKIEIMFWEYKNASRSKPWLKHFPDLNSPATVNRPEGVSSVYLEKKYFDEFKKFYSSLKDGQGVLINGKKMSASYRFPFPNL